MRMIGGRHRGDGGSHSRGGGDGTRSRGGASRSRGSVSRARSSRPRDAEGEENKKNAAQMTSLLDGADSNDTDVKEMSALNFSPEQLKAAIKKKERNIFVFTDDKQSSLGNREGGGDDMLELKHGVLSLSNPSQIEEPFSPSPHGGYLGDHFNYTNVEKMIGDQYDTRAIMTPFTPKGSGSGTPSRRTNYSFSSPLSKTSTQRGSSRKDKLFDVYAAPGPVEYYHRYHPGGSHDTFVEAHVAAIGIGQPRRFDRGFGRRRYAQYDGGDVHEARGQAQSGGAEDNVAEGVGTSSDDANGLHAKMTNDKIEGGAI
mmetsp:Transcript_1206/g.3016  ORF Transcript_1206/g.3016 Transcript_1206/m.3016 type:complete len:313 (+) Transcript_1206:68-1006(+)